MGCFLGITDIVCAVVTMAMFRPAPQRGHLDQIKCVYYYLPNYKKTATKFNTGIPDYAGFKVLEGNWGQNLPSLLREYPS